MCIRDSLYTTDSYKAMKTVLSDAEKVLKDSKDQTEIDAAAKALNDAVTALVPVSYTHLDVYKRQIYRIPFIS